MHQLDLLGRDAGELLAARGEKVGVAESSTGGLISAALLAVPGASRYYEGGAVVYTYGSRRQLFNLRKSDVEGMSPLSTDIASVFARRARETFGCTWAIAELGASGPTGTSYGHDPGVCVVAVDGPVCLAERIETGSAEREANMWAFTEHALNVLVRALRG